MKVGRQAADSTQIIILKNQSAISRAVNATKLCSVFYHKTSHGVFPAIRFTLWVVKVLTQANIYLKNRILLLWFAKALKHFVKTWFLVPFCFIVIGCFYRVMNDYPPLFRTQAVPSLKHNIYANT